MHNLPTAETVRLMPDIASSAGARFASKLDRVGMSEIEVPVLVADTDGVATRVPGKADAFVSLDDEAAKGIHMSRLFLALEDELASAPISAKLVGRILRRFLSSHEDLSETAQLTISYDHMLRRPSLKSDNRGWRSYPITFNGIQTKDGFRCYLGLRITYSSTCPCSAALSRQLIQQSFQNTFGDRDSLSPSEMSEWLRTEEAICATPHSQRSHADIVVEIADPQRGLDTEAVIDLVENVLKTPVQAAVKRADEQEFARLNGTNLMFCEDAARRVKSVLDRDERIADFKVRIAHLESLHPHDAVAIVTKGIEGGLRAE